MKLSIIIPCFNEEKVIAHTVAAIIDYMSANYARMSYELILINDGSYDKTLKMLKAFTNKHIKVINFDQNQGRGQAIKAGIANSLGEIVITLDADLSYDVIHIGDILQKFAHDSKIDAIIVSPYMKGGMVRNIPWKRLIISKMANWLLSGFFSKKISTVTCMVRGYKGNLIRKIKLLENGKELHLEILYKLGLYEANIQEIPGRLIWKDAKRDIARKSSLKFFDASEKHLLFAIAVKPTRVFIALTIILLLLGFYESFIILFQTLNNLDFSYNSATYMLWKALNQCFRDSPHTFFIAIGSLTLGFITFCMLVLLFIAKTNHDKIMKHMLVLLENKNLRK